VSIEADFLVRDADLVATCAGPAPRRGVDQGRVSPVERGAVAASGGRIVFVGASREVEAAVRLGPSAIVIDAAGCTVVPGLVDGHTHAVYAGSREDELARRLRGATYAEIAAEGGGILSTVRATRTATEDELTTESRPRLRAMLLNGTTTCEIKSGYGLTVEDELKMLRAIKALAATEPLDIVPTFMGAHEIPPEFRDRPDEFVALVVERMLPEVASAGLARWCDVFCETGVFTPAQSARILEEGRRHGLRPRIHADELGSSGGSLVASRVMARSADHLVHVDQAGIEALASAGVVATLLPTAAFYLKLGRYAPARALVAAGVPVALATDVNPGGGFSPSLPFAMALACFAMELTLEEALVASTINAAYGLELDDRVGSLEVGKQMDAVVVEGSLARLVHVGRPAIRHVVKRGRVVVSAGRLVDADAAVRAAR
jgi:imidazolonepropionase